MGSIARGAERAETAYPTFLLTDIEGSTRLWEEHRAAMAVALEQHDVALRESVQRANGTVVKSTGDGILAVFDEPAWAIEAAVDGLRGLHERTWDETGPLRVRMAIHSGTAERRDADFHGPALNRVARLLAIGHGDQVLVSGATASLLAGHLPADVELIDRGEHRLRDLAQPEHVFQAVAPDLRREFPPLLTARQTNLPMQLTSFVGREAELTELGRLVTSSRLVTLVGVGGTGKTRLMLEAAAAQLTRYADGAWLVELASTGDPARLVEEVVRALGAQGRPGQPAIDVVLDFLRAKQLLLLVDNCEHLIATVANVVQRLLAECPRLTIVATSREPLGVAGEVIYPVPSLTIPDPLDRSVVERPIDSVRLTEIGSWEAVHLFVDRATAMRPDFVLDAASAPAVVEITRRLDGIPLAIELAAARVNVLSVDEIAQGLGDRFRLLTGGRRTAVPRQQTLQALIDWSWELLGESDQDLLQRLSVFAGGWTLDSAVRVTGDAESSSLDILDGLGRLVDRSLVVADRGAGDTGSTRYRMLETIRQYARERLVAAGEAVEFRSRHLDLFSGLASEGSDALEGSGEVRWLRRLDPEVDNLRAALDWAYELAPERALRMTLSMLRYWQSRSAGSESVERFDQAVDRARVLAEPAAETDATTVKRRSELLTDVLAAAAFVNAIAGRPVIARAWAEELVARARTSGNRHALFRALSGLGLALIFSGDDPASAELTSEGLTLGEELGQWRDVAFMAAGLAMNFASSDPVAAQYWLDRATDAARRSGSVSASAFTSLARARVASYQGRLEDARRLFAAAEAEYQAIGDRGFELAVRSDLGHALRRAGLLDEAEGVYRTTIRGWAHWGNRGAIANQLESFAFLAIERGSMERGARLLGAAGTLRASSGAGMLGVERADYEAGVARLRASLDGPTVERVRRTGELMGTDEAVTYALSDEVD